jgi:hypothetical protein
MMKNVVENRGFWKHNGQPVKTEETVHHLTENIASELDAAPRLIRNTLNHALRKGDLICHETEDMIQCRWTDFLD